MSKKEKRKELPSQAESLANTRTPIHRPTRTHKSKTKYNRSAEKQKIKKAIDDV